MLQPPAAEPAYVRPERPGVAAIVLYSRMAPDGSQVLRLLDKTPARPWTLVAVVGGEGTVTTLRTEGLSSGDFELARQAEGFALRAPSGATPVSLAGDPASLWLPAHLFFTALWETRGDFASMTVGETRAGQGVFATRPLRAVPFALTRLVDPPSAPPGVRTVRRYRLVADAMRVELITDGRRLVVLRSADGVQATRIGAENWAASLPPLAEGAP